jgi:two-component system phosphate regulon sensor histidine kinase PhoR
VRTFRTSTTELRLFAAMALVVAIASAVGYSLLARDLRARELASLDSSLLARARLAALVLGDAPATSAGAAVLDALVDRAGSAAAARVTWIDASGRVLGDSEVPTDRLAALSDHRERPEIAQARVEAVGRDLRTSETVGRELLYLAIELPRGGFVRVASDLSGFDRALADLRVRVVASALAGLAAAGALALVLGRSLRRPLAELRRVATQLAGGDLDSVLPLRLRPELGAIADAVQQLGRQLRERLAETRAETQRLQAVLEGMAEGVLAVDTRGRIVLANDRWREFYGVTGELRGKRMLEVLRDVALDDLIDEASRAAQPVSREIRSTAGSPRVLRVQATRFPAAGDERLGTVAVFHDVTELERLEQIRRDFVANASHELRTPLAAIGGFAETLLASPELSEAERRNYLEIIERNARRLGKIVADLLDLARLERTEPELVLGAVDVGERLRRVRGDASARFAAKQLVVEERLDGDLRAWADAGAVDQILQNLVDNAIQYTEAGGRVTLEAEAEASAVVVRVRDTGVGIPAPDLERIFERFYRVDKARSRAQGGTGLGLSIVKHLVQRMRGEIRVESTVGVGTCVHLRLPRAAHAPSSPDRHQN